MGAQGFDEIAEILRRSTVQVSANGHGQGSGMIVKPEGIIVTNAHVARRSSMVQLWDGSSFPADLQSLDPLRDLAVLRIAASNLPAAALADSNGLRVGELVIAIGNPLGFIGALTTGVVHAIGPLRALGAMKWIQSDVQLAPGNSGGPLADARGRVVGVNTMVAGGLGLAIPIRHVAKLLESQPHQRPLGVVVRPIPMPAGGRSRLGMLILEVAKGSAAEFVSLKIGDMVTGVGDRAFNCIDDFEEALDGSGERVIRLHFLRGGQITVRTASVRLGISTVTVA